MSTTYKVVTADGTVCGQNCTSEKSAWWLIGQYEQDDRECGIFRRDFYKVIKEA